jgi:hypothetical protein
MEIPLAICHVQSLLSAREACGSPRLPLHRMHQYRCHGGSLVPESVWVMLCSENGGTPNPDALEVVYDASR